MPSSSVTVPRGAWEDLLGDAIVYDDKYALMRF